MQVTIYWNSDIGVPAAADNGVAGTEVYAPEGAIAIGGGGYATPYVSGQTYDTPSYPLVVTKPGSVPNAWFVGFKAPHTGSSLPVVKIHCYVVCLEDLPE